MSWPQIAFVKQAFRQTHNPRLAIRAASLRVGSFERFRFDFSPRNVRSRRQRIPMFHAKQLAAGTNSFKNSNNKKLVF
jgi:hypothetical protein